MGPLQETKRHNFNISAVSSTFWLKALETAEMLIRSPWYMFKIKFAQNCRHALHVDNVIGFGHYGTQARGKIVEGFLIIL